MEKIRIYCDGVCVYDHFTSMTKNHESFKKWLYKVEDGTNYGDLFHIFDDSQTKRAILNRNKISAVVYER